MSFATDRYAQADGRLPEGSLTLIPKAERQLSTVQLLRMVAALLVVAYHTTLEIWARTVNTGQLGYWHDMGGAGVDIFFVISGVVMTLSTRRPALAGAARALAMLFFKRRLIRIVPLYWFYTLLKAALIVLMGSKAFGSTVAAGFLMSSLLLFPVTNPAGNILPLLESGWTLSFEMLFYTILAIAIALRLPKMLTATVALALVYSVGVKGIVFFDFFSRSLLFEFVLGMIVANIWLRRRLVPGIVAVTMVIAALFALFLHRLPADRLLSMGVPAATLVLGMIWLERYASVRDLASRFHLMGDASYSIYLSHGFVVPLAVILGPRLGMQDSTMIFFLALVSSMLSGCALYLSIERPVTRFLNHRLVAPVPDEHTSVRLPANP